MTEERVRELLDQYTNGLFTSVSASFGVYIVGLLLFWAVLLFTRRSFRKSQRPRVHNYDIGADPRDALLGITPLQASGCKRPDDHRYFQTVLAAASEKLTQGKPLLPLERSVLGALAFLNRLLVTDDLTCLDAFPDALPHKEFELRNALQEIDAVDLIAPIEKAVAIYLHRLQMLQELMPLGLSREDALQHPDVPRYDPVADTLAQMDAPAYFTQKADAFFAQNYPWASNV